ncbi:hypothetical protein NNO_0612 [Hydrogenimonas sp.]|nr:hypothetical protein NNO_0612 [Hydrogenimonas sp.]
MRRQFFPEVHGCNGRDGFFYLYFEIWVYTYIAHCSFKISQKGQ